MARRLEGCLRAADTPARLGGDEFVVLMESISGEIAAIRLAERITACLNAPYRIDGHEVRVGVNLGVAVSVPGLDGPEQLLRSADVAMYRAKRRRRSATMPYDAFGGTGEG
jgi:diguanylate cyclase (GGDEF)-like protein